MRFEHGDTTYEFTFFRQHKRVKVLDKKSLAEGYKIYRWEKSRDPYTTVTLREVVKDEKAETWPILAEAEVGVLAGADRYSPEKGRIWSLKKLTGLIPAELRAPMWQAYHERPRGPQAATIRKELEAQVASLKAENKKLKNEVAYREKMYANLLAEKGGEHTR